MSRFHSYLNSAGQILQQYDGQEPFAGFIKKFFSGDKKYGSKDRKSISHLCYCFFRLGKWNQESAIEDRILTGLFLCSREPNELLENLRPEWNSLTGKPTSEKLLAAGNINLQNIFPWVEELSEAVDPAAFTFSHFQIPHLFIRLRPGHEEIVKTKLKKAGLSFKEISEHCLSLPNATRLDNVIEIDKEAVIQDLNSQRVAEFYPVNNERSLQVWDCCAASGGKSLLLFDKDPSVQLTVSDIRPSILANLKKRFARAGIRNYKSFVADLTANPLALNSAFDLIICDAPCTGSGSWSRTPEQLFYFTEEKISYYQHLQKKILKHAISNLRSGGFLAYSTCSVFRKENEEISSWLQNEFGLVVIKQEMLPGYDKQADTLFAALLQKPL